MSATIYSLPLRRIFSKKPALVDPDKALLDFLWLAADRSDISEQDWKLAFIVWQAIKGE